MILCHWRTALRGKSVPTSQGTILQVNKDKTWDIKFDDGVRQKKIPRDWFTPYVLRTEIADVRRINPATSSNCWLQYSCHGLPAFMLFHPDVPQKERTLANRTGRVGLITWRHRG